jgi:gliding motility-associated-like protein
LTLSAEGGTAPYTYQLANAASQTAAGPATFDSLSADSYDVTVTDANDCATQLNVAVAASPSQPLAATATPSPATCNGAENGQIAVSASGGLPPYAYRLAEPKQTQADSTFAGLAEGSYRVRVIDDCADTTAPQAVSVGTMFDVQAAFTLAQQELQLPEARLQLTNNSTNAGTYSWGFGEGSAATSAEPTHTYTDAGTYTVELVAQNGACADTAEQTVRVIAPDLNMPSVFTPNGDQLNDRFRLAPGTFEEVTFAVYNRWGHQVHSADRVVWDGTSRSGTDLPEGTYIYHLEGTLSNGVAVDRKGSITLLR